MRGLTLEQVLEAGRPATCIVRRGVIPVLETYRCAFRPRGPRFSLTLPPVGRSEPIDQDEAPWSPWHHDEGCDCRFCSEPD